MVAALQVALLGPTSAANNKSDECGLASVYSTNSEESTAKIIPKTEIPSTQ
jgi:hypothetical protein